MPFLFKLLDDSAKSLRRYLQRPVIDARIEMTNLPHMLPENRKIDVKIMDAAHDTENFFDRIQAIDERRIICR